MRISDWSSDVCSSDLLEFTDDTLLYAFYSRGYKAGGMNPPSPGFITKEEILEAGYLNPVFLPIYEQLGIFPVLQLTGVNYGPTFEPEFVNAFEIGTKNVLMGGRLTLNAGAFFYDYTDYQVSQIREIGTAHVLTPVTNAHL